jgi:hypothetical protein
MKRILILACCAALAFSQSQPAITTATQATLDHITADSLRGHLSFIASDLLEGRATPSPGLDIAAEYIAAQFRRAGLEAIGDDGYFQTANYVTLTPNPEGFAFSLEAGGKNVKLEASQVTFGGGSGADLTNAPVIKANWDKPELLTDLAIGALAGRALYLPEVPAEKRNAAFTVLANLDKWRPSLILTPDPRLARLTRSAMQPANLPRGPAAIGIAGTDAVALLAGEARITVQIAAPKEKNVKVPNVAGLLRGSDPQLSKTYVLVTAHYDHIGTSPASTTGDTIFNGANDDGSGTVSVVEIASALAAAPVRPKRSILFMTFFGEELGLVGSRYYGQHSLVPVAATIADINLEQIGRTDANNGPQVDNATFTGYDFTDVPAIFEAAGRALGVKVYKDEQRSDPFFARSDNQALADQGVPAHTMCVAFEYPDYHGLGDEWPKVDYNNMAKVDRMVALGLLTLASDRPAPKWNEANPKTAKYVEAAKKLK